MTSEPPRLSVVPALAAYALALLMVIMSTDLLFVAVAALRTHGDAARVPAEVSRFALSAPGIMTAATVSATILIAAAWMAAGRDARNRPGGLEERLGLNASQASGVGIAAAIGGMAGLSLASGSATELLQLRGPEGAMEHIATALASIGPTSLPLAIAAVAIGPGVAEEVFFRGLLQRPLVQRWGASAGIGICAAAFGLMHLDMVQSSVAFLAGIFLGWTALRLRGTRPTIAAHAVNNALFVAVTTSGGGTITSPRTQLVTLVAGLFLLAGSIAILRSPAALRVTTPKSAA